MEIVLRLYIAIIFLLQVENIISTLDEPQLRIWRKSPLAVIRNENSKLIAAIPHENPPCSAYARYHLGNIDKKDFIMACPSVEQGNVLYLQKYFKEDGSEISYLECETDLIPTVRKMDEPNNDEYRGDLYAVGYWVWNEKTKETDFVTIYEVRRSKTRTYYTTHTIVSNGFLKTNYREKLEIVENFYLLVPYYDMPVRSWQITTLLFAFNMVSLPKKWIDHLYEIDKYIKYATGNLETSLKVYSGRISIENEECSLIFKVIRHPTENSGVVIATLTADSTRCAFSCYQLDKTHGWTAPPQPQKQTLLFHRSIDQVHSYICEAEIGMLSAIELDHQLTPMEILIGPWYESSEPNPQPPNNREATPPKPTYLTVVGKPTA